MLEILLAGNNSQTHIMYRARISWEMLQRLLQELVQSRLVVIRDYMYNRKEVEITSLGIECLNRYMELRSMMNGEILGV